MAMMRGCDALVACLTRMGTQRVYGVIGTSIVGLLDGLYQQRDSIRYISCRHEQVAASMADAEGRLTRRPGVVVLHSGPGALNAMISVANAAKDCSPLLAISGTIKRRLTGCDGMLELDHVRVFRPLCKDAVRVENVSDIPRSFTQAFQAAMAGPGGPALLEIPEDLWEDRDEVNLDELNLTPPAAVSAPAGEVAAIVDRLLRATKPVILAGAGIVYRHAEELLRQVVERCQIPVCTTGNGRGALSETHPLSLGRAGYGGGNPVADEALRRADLIVGLGCTLSDMTSYEYTWPITADVVVVNLDQDNDQKKLPLEAVYADVALFLQAMSDEIERRNVSAGPSWHVELADKQTEWRNLLTTSCSAQRRPLSPAFVCRRLDELLPHDTIVTVGAGMHLLYPMAFMPSRGPQQFLSAVNFGAMGFGFPAALAAKLVLAERTVLAVQGDGDFLMTVQDLETAVREKIAVKILVINDNSYRVLAFRQRVQFDGHVYGSEHGNPDLVKLAESFGLAAWRLRDGDDVEPVLSSFVAAKFPALVEVVTDPQDIPPTNLEAAMRMSE
jgi:acetolactate synthase-1/2/3 large subunit